MRSLGNTSIKINRVGFGGLPIQRITQEETNVIIKELIKQDVNFIDTARGYTVSEEYLGNALEGIRNKFFIATKSMSRDYDGMKKDIDISLKNLKTDCIDLYQCHVVKPHEFEIILNENGAYKALLEARDEGKIKHIGITSHSIETIEKVLETDKFETIQFPYNIIENQAEEILKIANKKGIGTIIMKPLAGGAITDATLAIKYILNKEYIDVVIPGMDKVEQVKQNVDASINRELTEEDNNKIEEIKLLFGKHFCRRCEYCLPCPKNINIPQCFLLEGYYSRYNLKDWAVKRYSQLSAKASECIECGLCESRCPYELPIREMLKNTVDKLER